jgi:hypothetical protein
VSDRPRVVVIGAGSWGTAFAAVTAGNEVDTVLWARRDELAEAISSRHQNPEYLPGIELPPALVATHELDRAMAGATVAVMAVPSHAFRSIFRDLAAYLGPAVPVVSLSKGIERDSLKGMSEVITEEARPGPGAGGRAHRTESGQRGGGRPAQRHRGRLRRPRPGQGPPGRISWPGTSGCTRTPTWWGASSAGR